MRAAALLVALLAAAAPVAAPAAAAETYRWVDARGVVNYGDKPPAGAQNVRRLDEDAGRVSTIPAVPREDLARQRERLLEARIERLERELDEQRARAATAAAAPVVIVPAPVFAAGPAFVPVFVGPAAGVRIAHRPRFHGVFRPPAFRHARR